MARAARLLAFGALTVAAVVGQAAPGHAVTAVEAGWWSAPPLALAPDAPPDALVVQGGLAEALAYGAVRYTLDPDERPEVLTVRLAPNSASTPGTTLALCPLTERFQPAQGGPMADAPAFDCAAPVYAPPSADGATYEFDVAALERDGAVAVAILPTAPTDRVVLASPAADSLATSVAAVATPGAGGPSASDATFDGDVGASPSAPVPSGSSGAVATPRPVVSSPAATSAATPDSAAPVERATTPSAVATPAAQAGGSSERGWLPPAVFVGLAALAASLWLGRGTGHEAVA